MKIEWDLKGFSNGSQFSMECSSFASFDRWSTLQSFGKKIQYWKEFCQTFKTQQDFILKGKQCFQWFKMKLQQVVVVVKKIIIFSN